MGTTWTNYSLDYDIESFTPDYVAVNILSIGVTVLILIHSTLCHKTKYNSVRVQTELATIAALVAGILFLILKFNRNSSSTSDAFLFDFLYTGLFPLIIQLCDNYMFYSRLKAVTRVRIWKQRLIHLYIFLILSVTWFPIYSIVPFFYDTNAEKFAYYYFITLSIQVWGTVAYNFYFTFEFSMILRSISTGKASQTEALGRISTLRAIISFKSIIHCITSSLASLIYLYIPKVGNPVYVIMIVFAMHILFNSKVERSAVRIGALCPTLLSAVFFSTTRICIAPSSLSGGNELKGYRDVSIEKAINYNTQAEMHR
jgi:hypothetical protein